ncbi:MAG: hypothetical protein PS018_26515 [bacterium]|nr:hypothetical protein [bacterium]
MNALNQTFADFTAAIRVMVDPKSPDTRGATFASLPRAFRVIDEDTGECVGSVQTWPQHVQWWSGSFGGYAATMDAALAAIEAKTLTRRAEAA